MDRYTYNCNYCGNSYVPKRRYKQKYCSNSCRVNAFMRRKKQNNSLPQTVKQNKIAQKDRMSLSGIGNAAVGTLATNIVTNLLTKEDNKPATKGDLRKLLNEGLKRTILVKNLPPESDGTRAYFDTTNETLVYK